MKPIPERSYLKYYGRVDNHVEELLQKATTVPELITTPVAAEKKRNELLNAVRLGKRPRTDEESGKQSIFLASHFILCNASI